MDIMLERILSLIPKKENGDFQHGAKKEFAQSIGFKNGNIVSLWISGASKSYKGKLAEISDKYNGDHLKECNFRGLRSYLNT